MTATVWLGVVFKLFFTGTDHIVNLAKEYHVMKLFSVFDTNAESYQVRDAVDELRSIKGVKSIEVMERVAGEVPRYCVVYDIDDDGGQETVERIRQATSQYSGYVRNSAWGAYKKIG